MRGRSGQGQCCKRNFGRTNVQEEMLGATETQQRHKEPRSKRAIISGKQENTQKDLQAGCRAEIIKQTVRTSLDCGKSVSRHCGGVSPLQNNRRDH
jgi:hypothetical protein